MIAAIVRSMRNMFDRNRGTAECRYEILPGHQLMLRVRGVLTETTHKAVAVDLDRIANGMLARSMVVDFRGAVIALTEQQLFRTPESLSYAVRTLPIAIVTDPALSGLFREHAWVASKLGLLRGAFEGLGVAHRWAAGKESLALYFQTQEAARSS